ncbi:hypothetical protein BH24GEM2_BH24GEM2_05960 [soil metagenome]
MGIPLAEVVEGKLYYGIKTGLNEAFIIDRRPRDRLVASDTASAEIIKPVLRGEDLRPWYQKDSESWIIFTRRGIKLDKYPAVAEYLTGYRKQLEPRPADWDTRQNWPGRKAGSYKWFEIQDTVEYHEKFASTKIFWPDIAKLPRFSWSEEGKYVNDTGFFLSTADPALLGILQSRVSWFAISNTAIPLRLRAGLWQYRLKTQFLSRLPIPPAPPAESKAIGALAMQVTKHVRDRYALHERVRHRIATDLDTASRGLNQKLTAWWGLDFPAFRAEVKKALRQEIPLRDRDDWQAWLSDGRAEHQQHTTEIVRLETELNARVYELFDLSPAEIQIIEESTKYRYGEV